jgi:glutamine amidotransferase
MIGIIDFGLGNLTSVAGAVAKVGFDPIVTNNPDELARMDKLILPGVGAFGDGMKKLHSGGLVDPLNDLVLNQRKPILGICLGFQLIAKSSDEYGSHGGLGWVDAEIKKINPSDNTLRVPHVGWNELYQVNSSILFDDIPDGELFYYVHSHRMEKSSADIAIGECDYGGRFVSAIQSGNVYGTQFHPEKSQFHGLALLKNFLEKS